MSRRTVWAGLRQWSCFRSLVKTACNRLQMRGNVDLSKITFILIGNTPPSSSNMAVLYKTKHHYVKLWIKLVDKLDSLLNIRHNYNYNLVNLVVTPNLFYSLETVATIRMYAYP